MTRKEKQLLLKDLCARLPYGVKCDCKHAHAIILTRIDIEDLTVYYADCDEWEGIEDCKPYLRPMSSMTEEELNHLRQYVGLVYGHPNVLDLSKWDNGHTVLEFWLDEVPHYVVTEVFDWLNAHYFDFRYLIEKGFALDAPEGMYKN